MKYYLNNFSKQLRNYSLSLDKTSILIEKPWILYDDDYEIQRLIFKKNKELVLSKAGKAQLGKWDYFPEAKSLLIDRNSDKILCNEVFVNEGVIILKVDSFKDYYIILANENIIPDLNIKDYLVELREKKLNIFKARLKDGKVLDVERDKPNRLPQIGDPVSLDLLPCSDGKYKLETDHLIYEIKQGRIYMIFHEKKYINTQNQSIIIQQQNNNKIFEGDYIFMNGEPVNSGVLDFNKSKNLVVEEGKVVRLVWKNKLVGSLIEFWKRMSGYYNPYNY